MEDRDLQTVPMAVPLEVVAAITAALSVIMTPGSFAITAIAPAGGTQGPGSAWARAGVLEQQLTRSGVYLWGRR